MSSSQSDLEPEHASVEFFTKTSTTFGKTHFLARYIGFPPAYDELIPEEELIIKYDDPLLPNLESGVLRKQATQQEQSASQTLPTKPSDGVLAESADHWDPYRNSGDLGSMPFPDAQQTGDARYQLAAALEMSLDLAKGHVENVESIADGDLAIEFWEGYIGAWEELLTEITEGSSMEETRLHPVYKTTRARLLELDQIISSIPKHVPSSLSHLNAQAGRHVQLYEWTALPETEGNLKDYTLEMLAHKAVIANLRDDARYDLDRTDIPTDYLLSRLISLIVDSTDIIRIRNPTLVGTAGTHLSRDANDKITVLSLSDMMYTAFQISKSVMDLFNSSWYASRKLWPTRFGCTVQEPPSPIQPVQAEHALQARYNLEECYDTPGHDRYKIPPRYMKEEYALNWETMLEDGPSIARLFLDSFHSGPLAMDLAASLLTMNRIRSRASKDGTKGDGKFSDRLYYDNTVISGLARSAYRSQARRITGNEMTDHFHPAIDRLNWVGTVLAEMNALHSRPVVTAFILACAQHQAWHQFTAFPGSASVAFQINKIALDFVTSVTSSAQLSRLLTEHSLGANPVNRHESRPLQCFFSNYTCDNQNCTNTLEWPDDINHEVEIPGDRQLSTKARDRRALSELTILKYHTGPEREHTYPCPDDFHDQVWSVQLWATYKLVGRCCHLGCKFAMSKASG